MLNNLLREDSTKVACIVEYRETHMMEAGWQNAVQRRTDRRALRGGLREHEMRQITQPHCPITDMVQNYRTT